MEDVKGSEYLQKIKEALKSKEFQSYTSPQRPYIIKFAELKSLSNIENCFPYNKEFSNALKKIAQQEFNMKNIYNPQNEMFRLLGTKRSFSQNETFFFSHP